MGFISIVVSPVIRADQDYHRRELWHLKQEIKDVFKKYNSTTCSYLLRNFESSFYGYQDNFAIVDFKKKECAARALKAVENGEISINRLTITAKPIELTHCPIDRLPDNCLLELFEHLSTYEQLKLSSVCKRWGKVSRSLWRTTAKIDLRNKSLVHKNKKYIINSGSHLKDIYCYDDYGLKIIGDHCKNLESIAIEFRKYMTRRGLDRACIQYEGQTLQQFANLTRLMLKIRTPQYTYFSFLQNLPSTMIEIHLFNDIEKPESGRERWMIRKEKLAKFAEPRAKYGRKTLDLSRFTNLRALTLRCYHLDDDSLIGLEKLEKLICLRLDRSHMSKLTIGKLKFFTNLEHLSLKRCSVDYDDMWLILKRNRNLKYLALPQMSDFYDDEKIWLRALELEHLKVLCWVDIERKIRESSGRSTTIEYIELHDVCLSDRRTLLLLEDFPNLKVLKRTGFYGYPSDWYLSDVRNVIMSRPDKAPMRYYHEPRVRRSTERYIPFPSFNSENFEHSEVVSAEDARIFRCNEWDGWYIEDSSASPDPPKTIDDQPVESMTTSPSIIEELSDDCLNRIFNHLPLDDELTAAEVCRRWKEVLGEKWENCKKLDVRELSCHENREKCMVQCGKYFEDVYTYKSCGFSGIKAHCPNVKSLGLDFGIKRCRCRPSSRKERYSLRSLQPTLMGLKHLCRIMLRDAPVFQSDISEHLPESLEEIHVFNRRPMSFEESTEPQQEDNASVLDLSRYSKLRALTLIEAQVNYLEPSRKSVRVIGLENLEELIYLRVSRVVISEESGDPLRNVKKLEYLSMPLSTLSADNFRALIENNRNLEYLDITDNFDGVPISKFLPVLSLRRLRYLRMVNIAAPGPEHIGFHDIPEEIEIDGMQCLEIFDCKGPEGLPNDLFLRIIGASQNLKIVNVSVIDGNLAEELLAVAGSNVFARRGLNTRVKAFVGMEGFRLSRNLGLHVDGVILSEVPPQNYCVMVERSYWGGWSTQGDKGNTSNLLSELFKVINH
ncbi:uncharacterized protein LOC107038584 [Diachasma alloeum]|uniref:uncharacterized protein LOC107038584 n=1 Tax=Diachasma alloeum TaxID=454923 RepID=UPI0007382D03|nr:uncharacterized protein LOC107038584 [Diachasma alloeum]